MAILVFALIVVLIAGLVIYAIDYLALAQPFNSIAKLLIIIIAIVLIANRAGFI